MSGVGPARATSVLTRSGAVGIIVAAGLAACGKEKLTAGEFVDRANENGAHLELGAELFTDVEDKELFEVELVPPPGSEAESESGDEHGHEHGGGAPGSIAVLDDSDAAAEEVERCRTSADLLCYQAGNIALTIEAEGGPAGPAALARAIERMGE